MVHNALHEPLPQAMATIRLQHKHIADINVRRVVRDYAAKTHLPRVTINAKTKGILDGPSHDFARDPLGPITLCQKTMDDIHIQPLFICADDELASTMFRDLSLVAFHFV